jgi:hypothetical protein
MLPFKIFTLNRKSPIECFGTIFLFKTGRTFLFRVTGLKPLLIDLIIVRGKVWELTSCLKIDNLWSTGNLMPELTLTPLHIWLFNSDKGLRIWILVWQLPTGNRTWASAVGGRTLEKSHSNTLCCCYSESLHCWPSVWSVSSSEGSPG